MPAVSFPWPNRVLSPNSRSHRMVVYRAQQSAKESATWLSKCAGVRPFPLGQWLIVSVTFRPPDRRRRDLDNCIGMFKPWADGLALAAGVDDARWRVTYAMADPVKDGRVDVTVAALGAGA